MRGGVPGSEEAPGRARRRTTERLLRWSVPLVSVLVAIASQVLVPRFLQLGLSEGEYVAYIAVTSVGAYVGLGEGGVLVSLLRELSALHGAGDRAGFAAEVRRSRRFLVFAALAGGVIASCFMGSALGAAARAWPGAHEPRFMLATVACIAATMLELFLGSYHTALLFSTGRLVLGQLVGVAVSLVPVTALVTLLAVRRDLTLALYGSALASATVALLRGAHAGRVLAVESFGVEAVAPRTRLFDVVGSGVALKLAEVLQTAAYPHLLTVLAAPLVAAAIPARTLANAARLVTGRFVDVLQVHVTRGLAGPSDVREKARRQYGIVAPFLTSIHVVEVAGIAALAPTVFELWLPQHAASVRSFLPGLLAEQALLAACLPTSILLMATGHLKLLGLVRIVGVPVGLGLLPLLLPLAGHAALGLSLAASALPYFFAGLWSELVPLHTTAPPRREVALRYAVAALAAASCAGYERWPLVTVMVVGGAGATTLAWAGPRSIAMLKSA